MRDCRRSIPRFDATIITVCLLTFTTPAALAGDLPGRDAIRLPILEEDKLPPPGETEAARRIRCKEQIQKKKSAFYGCERYIKEFAITRSKPESTQRKVKKTGNDPTFSQIVSAFKSSQPVPMGPKSTLVLGGMVDNLTSRCKDQLSLSFAERTRLADFISTAATRAALGGRYGDPDLGNGIGSQISGTVVYATGGKMVEGVSCGNNASAILKHIVFSINEQRDEGGRFVSTCMPRHSAESCKCLAELGQSVSPNFQDQAYSREAVHGVIKANPFIGLMITGKCGIVKY